MTEKYQIQLGEEWNKFGEKTKEKFSELISLVFGYEKTTPKENPYHCGDCEVYKKSVKCSPGNWKGIARCGNVPLYEDYEPLWVNKNSKACEDIELPGEKERKEKRYLKFIEEIDRRNAI